MGLVERLPYRGLHHSKGRYLLARFHEIFQVCFLIQVPKSPFEYTIEISPPTEAPIKSYLYHSVPDMFGSINNR